MLEKSEIPLPIFNPNFLTCLAAIDYGHWLESGRITQRWRGLYVLGFRLVAWRAEQFKVRI